MSIPRLLILTGPAKIGWGHESVGPVDRAVLAKFGFVKDDHTILDALMTRVGDPREKVSELVDWFCNGWRNGFDDDGAEPYHGALVGSGWDPEGHRHETAVVWVSPPIPIRRQLHTLANWGALSLFGVRMHEVLTE